jgi:dihydrofolate reductase
MSATKRIIASVYSSLDGVMQPLDWTAPYAHPDHAPYQRDLLLEADTLLLGRGTYEIFSATWAARTEDDPGSEGLNDYMNSMRKLVASTTLQEPLAWNNAHLLQGDLVTEIAKVKAEGGKAIITYGAGPVAHILLLNGLLDELRIWLYPVIAGAGQRLFDGATDIPLLALQDITRFASGVMVLTYTPRPTG